LLDVVDIGLLWGLYRQS